MIAILIAAVIVALCLFQAVEARNHPKPVIGKGIKLGAAVIGSLALIIGLGVYPFVQVWQATYATVAKERATEVELHRANAMIGALGSSSAYIEYLKATKDQ